MKVRTVNDDLLAEIRDLLRVLIALTLSAHSPETQFDRVEQLKEIAG